MNDTQQRFLRMIAERVPVERIVELHLFAPIRQGGTETGVAVFAALTDVQEDERAADAAEAAEAAEAGDAPPIDGPVDDPGEDAPIEDPPADPAPVEPPPDEPAPDGAPVGDPTSDAPPMEAPASSDAPDIPLSVLLEMTPVPADGKSGTDAADAADAAAAPDDDAAPVDDPSGSMVEESSAAVAPPATPTRPPVVRHVVMSARYRLTLKGVDRGKWEVDVVEEADAPLITVDKVVRGVQRRAGDLADVERFTSDTLQQALSETLWATKT